MKRDTGMGFKGMDDLTRNGGDSVIRTETEIGNLTDIIDWGGSTEGFRIKFD
jgi:hypothetical protein